MQLTIERAARPQALARGQFTPITNPSKEENYTAEKQPLLVADYACITKASP